MTDTPMTPDRLAEIRNRKLDEVTSGPWLLADDENGRPLVYAERVGGHGRTLALPLFLAGAATEADAQFVASARQAVPELLAEVDRLRGELSDATAELAENARAMNALRRHRDTAEARIAALTAAPVDEADEAAELAEGAAELEAMRRDHPAPCRVPDSPDCTCPSPERLLARDELKRMLRGHLFGGGTP
ncbi:hypothetical protein ACIA71_01740 [Streptomyces anulatus]